MVRTLDNGGRATGGKASRKNLGSSVPSSGGSSEKNKGISNGGGNPVCPRETPSWQKPITTFFTKPSAEENKKESDGNKENVNQNKPNLVEVENSKTPESSDEEYDEVKQPTKKIKISVNCEEKDKNDQDNSNSDEEPPAKKKAKLRNVIIEESD